MSAAEARVEALEAELARARRERAEYARTVADLTERLEARVEELELIARVGQMLAGELDLSRICAGTVTLVLEAIGPEHCSLMLVDHAAEALVLAAVQGAYDDAPQIFAVQAEAPRFALGEGVAGAVAVEGRSVRLDDARDDARFVALDQPGDDRVQPVSLLVLPLRIKDRVVGVMNLSDSVPEAFHERQERLLSLIAQEVALALEHARLYAEVRHSREALASENQTLRQALEGASEEQDPDLVGSSLAFRKVLALVDKVASTSAGVLLQGESGTGKEVVARAIHRRSPRRDQPFVALNCAALPESLLESELFGIERGVATGVDARPGTFEQADGGTLFLDEIGDMAPTVQAKVLRVIQERQVVRVGGGQPIKVDVRLLAATHRDLADEMQTGRFRADLYYRLKVVQIDLPPLRRRREDIVPLADHFLRRFALRHGSPARRLSRAGARALLGHPWPGNVRELMHAIEQAVIVAEGQELTPDDLGLGFETGDGVRVELPAHVEGFHEVVADVQARAEVQLLARALAEHDGNRTHAARALGLSRRALIYKVQQYGL